MGYQEDFINQIAPLVQKIAPEFGIKCCSAVIAQACKESAFGTSNKARHNNYFGLKYRLGRVSCHNGLFVDGSKEERAGVLVPITDQWYSFANMEQGVRGYFQFINIANYSNVKGVTDPREYLHRLCELDHYCTSSTYVDSAVNDYINKYNLTQYDPKGVENVEIEIKKVTSTANTTTCTKRIPEYIVVHYTAGTSSAKGAATNVAKYFSKSTTQASADFITDDEEIVQFNPDPTTRYCWAVGGNKYSKMSTSEGGKFYGKCKNANSISIEMCSRKTNTKTLSVSDPDWYLTDATINNTVKLVKYLMQLYNVPADKVIMHHHVNGKPCPQPWTMNESRLSGWNEFKAKITGSSVPVAPTPEPAKPSGNGTPFLVQLLDDLNIRKTPNGAIVIPNGAKKGIKYTIVEVSGNWGKLKSGAGWICISPKYVNRV